VGKNLNSLEKGKKKGGGVPFISLEKKRTGKTEGEKKLYTSTQEGGKEGLTAARKKRNEVFKKKKKEMPEYSPERKRGRRGKTRQEVIGSRRTKRKKGKAELFESRKEGGEGERASEIPWFGKRNAGNYGGGKGSIRPVRESKKEKKRGSLP